MSASSARLPTRALFKSAVIVATILLTAAAALWAAGSHAQSAGGVRGRVTDDQGRPVAGAQMRAYYQSYGGGQLQHGGSYNRGAVTDRDGRYSISLQGLPPGIYSVSGTKEGVNLTPQRDETFGSHVMSIRNFTHGYVESTDDDDYGNGAIFVAENAIGDYTDLTGLEVTFRSRDGRVITKTVRRTGEGQSVTGIPFGTYEVSARLNGRPVRIKSHEHFNGAFTASVTMTSKPGVYDRMMRTQIQP